MHTGWQKKQSVRQLPAPMKNEKKNFWPLQKTAFWQALQMVWFAHVYFQIEVCTTACGFGRFDQYMWPYYKKDVIDEKNITQDEALEMLECFYLKACEVYEVRDKWYATSFAGYPMWEILVVGGQTPDG